MNFTNANDLEYTSTNSGFCNNALPFSEFISTIPPSLSSILMIAPKLPLVSVDNTGFTYPYPSIL